MDVRGLNQQLRDEAAHVGSETVVGDDAMPVSEEILKSRDVDDGSGLEAKGAALRQFRRKLTAGLELITDRSTCSTRVRHVVGGRRHLAR